MRTFTNGEPQKWGPLFLSRNQGPERACPAATLPKTGPVAALCTEDQKVETKTNGGN